MNTVVTNDGSLTGAKQASTAATNYARKSAMVTTMESNLTLSNADFCVIGRLSCEAVFKHRFPLCKVEDVWKFRESLDNLVEERSVGGDEFQVSSDVVLRRFDGPVVVMKKKKG